MALYTVHTGTRLMFPTVVTPHVIRPACDNALSYSPTALYTLT